MSIHEECGVYGAISTPAVADLKDTYLFTILPKGLRLILKPPDVLNNYFKNKL